jgi:hypothetical protein
MAEIRTPFPSAPPAKREADTRFTYERPKKWMPPQMLPDPYPEEGYAFRWIRLSTLGINDPMNISSKLREGWEPVKASDHPEVQLMGGNSNHFPDSIEVGGLLLCKTPTEFVKQRDAHFQQITEGQMQSIDNNLMRENDPRMPLFKERKTKVTFGKGS